MSRVPGYYSATLHLLFFFFNDTATTEIYTLSLHDALPISPHRGLCSCASRSWGSSSPKLRGDRKSTRLNSSHGSISYAVFCLKKKKDSQGGINPRKKKKEKDCPDRCGISALDSHLFRMFRALQLEHHSDRYRFFFNDTATTEIYTLSLHDALPIPWSSIPTASHPSRCSRSRRSATRARDRKSTRLNSSHGSISYAVFCLKKKKKTAIPFPPTNMRRQRQK